ncbi:hypothetical protein A2110_01065 [Candidatus Jorgensenbacteria bacterium GWA1_54_12]|uniref:DNA recombination protein RmuC n=1 Tax=Candidatus Jorgensenbacteria bacterium GWA1_54_12 TaxID=1798468 RepID=A0A1F6BIQ0_9BACT|nr:MAG: hypothetical protein A2110_01065 [Candidatus Jorgensenbacteria bacterium GWA1_54_12]
MEFGAFLTLLIVILAGFGAVIFVITRRGKKPAEDQSFLMLQGQLGDMQRAVQEAVKTQFTESQKLIRDITRQLTEVREGNKQVFDVAAQLKNLEQVLKNQKQRGSLGEEGLALILGNILPPDAYKLQYAFANGEAVDAAIFTKDGIIPVDAKFSLDNYIRITEEKDEEKKAELEKQFRNDLKRRIDETSKYIRPQEGTLPFAFMYIPAEPIYYDLLVNEVGSVKANTRSLIEYAYKDKNVIIVSPTTFAAYLQSVLYGFRAFKIEESAKLIGKWVESLGRHVASYDMYFKKIGASLGTTVSHYNSATKELQKIDRDVLRITGNSPGIEPLELEKPKADEE